MRPTSSRTPTSTSTSPTSTSPTSPTSPGPPGPPLRVRRQLRAKKVKKVQDIELLGWLNAAFFLVIQPWRRRISLSPPISSAGAALESKSPPWRRSPSPPPPPISKSKGEGGAGLETQQFLDSDAQARFFSLFICISTVCAN